MENWIQRYRKQAVAAAVVLFLLASVVLRQRAGEDSGPPPAPSAGPVVVSVAAEKPAGLVRAGTVETAFAVPVYSGFSGGVSELYVADGQGVKAGQPLFKLEPLAGERPVAKLGANSYAGAQQDYDRAQKLFAVGAIPRKQMEAAAARLQAAQAAGPGAAAPAGPVTVTAPVDGIVSGLAVATGGAVEAGQQTLTLGGGQSLAVVVPLQQEELNAVPLGAQALIEAGGQSIKGQVLGIFPEEQGNRTLLFRVHIRPNNPPAGALLAGATVNVRLEVAAD